MKHVRGLRRAGVLLIAAMAVAGCSTGGGAGTDDAPEARESTSSAASDGADGADGSEDTDDADARASDEAPPWSDAEFSEEAATAAIEAVVPTSQVMSSEETRDAVEETLAGMEELDSSDHCTDLLTEQYRLQLEDANATVQGVVDDSGLLEPGASEVVSVHATGEASKEAEEIEQQLKDDCQAEDDELTTDESTLGDCDLAQEEYIRPGTSGRRTVVLRCEGATVSYNSMKPAEMEGDVEEWNEEAVERATEVLEQMAG